LFQSFLSKRRKIYKLLCHKKRKIAHVTEEQIIDIRGSGAFHKTIQSDSGNNTIQSDSGNNTIQSDSGNNTIQSDRYYLNHSV
jgi:hypothetical protein